MPTDVPTDVPTEMPTDVPTTVPGVEGILDAADIALTAASIAAMQEPSGAVPWTVGQHTDVWNHVEAAMALLVGGQVEASDRAFAWVPTMQRADGSFPLKVVAGDVEDASGETNMSAYLAVGVWHNWLVRGDLGFVRRYWPIVRRALDWVCSMQLPFGGIAWSQEWRNGRPGAVNAEALLAGSSSIYQALRAGLAVADLVDDPQPGWELAAGRLGHAISAHEDLFLDKRQFSMDWYYPVLGGVITGDVARARLDSRWDEFVEPGLGIRCVSNDPWVTGAETCELALALEAAGERECARRLFADMQHLREKDGSYWTGYVFPDDVNWPPERTTYTAAAVILAADSLGEGTAGAGIMRSAALPATIAEPPLECGCESADRVARIS